MEAGTTTTPTLWCAAATVSCLWMCMCRGARRRRKLWYTVSCSCRKKFGGRGLFCVADESMTSDLELEAVAVLPGVTGARRELGELVVDVARDAALALLRQLRDEFAFAQVMD